MEGQIVKIVFDPTHCFSYGAEFRLFDFGVTLAGEVWPDGMIVEFGDRQWTVENDFRPSPHHNPRGVLVSQDESTGKQCRIYTDCRGVWSEDIVDGV